MFFDKSASYFIKLPKATAFVLVCFSFFVADVIASNNPEPYKFKQVKPSKVKIGTASEFDEVTELATQIESFDALVEYLESQSYDSLAEAIKATEDFVDRANNNNIVLTGAQRVDMNLLLAQLYTRANRIENSEFLLIKVSGMDTSENQSILLKTIESQNHQAQQNWFLAAAGYKQVFALAQQVSDINSQVKVASELANIYFQILDNHQAKSWIIKATDLARTSDDLALFLEVSTLAASQLQDMNELELAESVLSAVIGKVKTLKLISVEISLSKQLSDVYLQANELDKARGLLEYNYPLASKLRNVPQQYALLSNLIKLELAQSDTLEASKIMTQADKLTKYISDVALVVEFTSVKAQVYAAQRKYVEALQMLDKVNALSQTNTKQNTNKQLALKQRAQWQALLGRSRSAISNFDKLHRTEQRMLSDKAQQRIRFIQQSYVADKQRAKQELEQRQQQIQTLENEKEQLNFELTRNFVIYVILFLAALIYWLFYQKKQQLERLQLMNLDLISGAKNHNYLSRRFRQYVQHKVNFSLVMFDIDGMTRLNNELGHDNADLIFRQIVQRLAIRLSAEKELIRMAGDKFMVIVENFNQKQAFLLAEILRKELNNESYVIDGKTFEITASFSAIEFKHGETLESLKQALNLSVQIAKQAGGDKTTQMLDD